MSVTHIVSRSPDDTFQIARELLAKLEPGAVLALHGELGSGKTCFVQGLAAAMDVRRAVSSPTFTLVNEYDGATCPLYHIDLYRISGPEEAFGLGIEDYLHGPGITAIEWAERISELIPATAIHIRFIVGTTPGERLIQIQRGGAS